MSYRPTISCYTQLSHHYITEIDPTTNKEVKTRVTVKGESCIETSTGSTLQRVFASGRLQEFSS